MHRHFAGEDLPETQPLLLAKDTSKLRETVNYVRRTSAKNAASSDA